MSQSQTIPFPVLLKFFCVWVEEIIQQVGYLFVCADMGLILGTKYHLNLSKFDPWAQSQE